MCLHIQADTACNFFPSHSFLNWTLCSGLLQLHTHCRQFLEFKEDADSYVLIYSIYILCHPLPLCGLILTDINLTSWTSLCPLYPNSLDGTLPELLPHHALTPCSLKPSVLGEQGHTKEEPANMDAFRSASIMTVGKHRDSKLTCTSWHRRSLIFQLLFDWWGGTWFRIKRRQRCHKTSHCLEISDPVFSVWSLHVPTGSCCLPNMQIS